MALPFIIEILNKVRRLELEPIGIIRPWPSATAPKNWFECDGSALESAEYPLLFGVIGTRFGDGTSGIGATGSTDFNLPDLRGRFIRGCDNGAGNDPDASTRGNSTPQGGTGFPGQATGDNIGSLQGDTIKPHTHNVSNFPNGQNARDGGDGAVGQVTDSGNSGGNETRPKNLYCMYIIRY